MVPVIGGKYSTWTVAAAIWQFLSELKEAPEEKTLCGDVVWLEALLYIPVCSVPRMP